MSKHYLATRRTSRLLKSYTKRFPDMFAYMLVTMRNANKEALDSSSNTKA